MSKVAIFMATGCEEIEGLTVVDLLRRANIEIDMISITGEKQVVGSHNIAFLADKTIEEANLDEYDGVVLPGGIPGTPNLGACEKVTDTIKAFAKEGKLVAAICAAPSVLGQNGIMEGKRGTSYPGFAEEMKGCDYKEQAVVVDGNIITSRGMGTAIDFGLAIIAYYQDASQAAEMSKKIIYK